MTNSSLSPAAQAIDTALADCIQLSGEIIRARPLAAAALRAAAEQLGYHIVYDDGELEQAPDNTTPTEAP